ncbi:MAG: hypothetical protein Q7S21_00665 [archaeon]|nr:hypothetical protein [archaeon]
MTEMDLEYQMEKMLNSLEDKGSNGLRNNLYDLVGVLEYRKLRKTFSY